MRIKDLFEHWGLVGLKVNTGVFEAEFEPSDPDRDAAWDLYVDLLTRVATQKLPHEYGIEKTALNSIFKIFEVTRTTLKAHGRKAENFTKIAVIVLNQVIRPFTSKWHRLSEEGAFNDKEKCLEFREELAQLQIKIGAYTRLLSELADVEDMTEMEVE